NATRALAISRNRNGRRVPPQFQRMDAEDLVAQVFPDQIACFENIQGKRQVPQHPLVQQTIHDCLTEAMDIEGLKELVAAIEGKELTLIARDLREPSPFAQEIINARPYAFLDDAPFEERRTLALRNRSWLDPAEATELSALDAEAIARVKDEAWPFIRSPEELHDALLTHAFLTEGELRRGPEGQDLTPYIEPLRHSGRATRLDDGTTHLWIAAERLPQFEALGKDWCIDPPLSLPARLREREWSREEALREITRGRLEALGPVTVTALAAA